jgi:SpoIID/LytB domain protein
MEKQPGVAVVLMGRFRDASGRDLAPGAHEFSGPVQLTPRDGNTDRFVLPNVTIGIGFHWERQLEQTFTGSLRLEAGDEGLTVINDVPIEDYVESVIASEMSGDSPLEFLKAHAVISRSWVAAQIAQPAGDGTVRRERRLETGEHELMAWYGRESHTRFDVCADDHCQRYQGVGRSVPGRVSRAVRETAAEFLTWNGEICDARFSKCCGGVTESFDAAWDDRVVRYLRPVYDGEGELPVVDDAWILSTPPAWCNTSDRLLIEQMLPGFDQETTDFYRWQLTYTPEQLGALVGERSGIDLGPIEGLEPLERGRSGRIVKLRIRGKASSLVVGKELEIRRVLSESHLYSSAFVAEAGSDRIVLHGAGWGHGVGLCQIGAGAQAFAGRRYDEILAHYYPETDTTVRT